jgi:signal transduction histidine kinase
VFWSVVPIVVSFLVFQGWMNVKELGDKSHQLESASRHKLDFLANVSHELRTPMNAILGFHEMILDQVYGEIGEDLKRPLTDIQQSGRHLLRLIKMTGSVTVGAPLPVSLRRVDTSAVPRSQ